jgi:hypothetical protein
MLCAFARCKAWRRAINDRKFIGQRHGKCWLI